MPFALIPSPYSKLGLITDLNVSFSPITSQIRIAPADSTFFFWSSLIYNAFLVCPLEITTGWIGSDRTDQPFFKPLSLLYALQLWGLQFPKLDNCCLCFCDDSYSCSISVSQQVLPKKFLRFSFYFKLGSPIRNAAPITLPLVYQPGLSPNPPPPNRKRSFTGRWTRGYELASKIGLQKIKYQSKSVQQTFNYCEPAKKMRTVWTGRKNYVNRCEPVREIMWTVRTVVRTNWKSGVQLHHRFIFPLPWGWYFFLPRHLRIS